MPRQRVPCPGIDPCKKLREWGKPGTGPGEFDTLHGIGISPEGNIYIADRDNHRIQWFDSQGKFLGQFKYPGEVYTLTINRAGDLYAVTHVPGAPLDLEKMPDGHGPFTIHKIDRGSSKMLAKIEIRTHQVGTAPDGTILPGTRSPSLVLFKPHK